MYVVFRGSSSIPNWISDLDAFKTAYTSYPECNCQVHKGFYLAEQNVIKDVVGEVKRLKGLYPSYNVKVSGGNKLFLLLVFLCALLIFLSCQWNALI
ncbi:hypothetical protein EON65_04620 [archaeon]|nr:MAG: hypothetical protein EON65_04620 [archaeon]